ncbi:MAG TPA: hypothetical protein VNT30_09385 [Stellaceae bacterium]|nr:hypothetical protein [Stellaceae bacterium]
MTVATAFSTQMTQLTGNAGGAIQQLPNSNVVAGRERCFIANIALATQAIGTVFGVARIGLLGVITGITLITDTSLGSATIALGDANSSAIYMAASVLTATNTPTRVGLASTHGAPIATGYDCVSGLVSKSYEDIILTTAVAALPASGNLAIIFEYVID